MHLANIIYEGELLWKIKYQLYGGDLRMIRLVELFLEESYTVFVYGQEKYWKNNSNERLKKCNDLRECLDASDIIVGAIPLSRDNITVSCEYSEKQIGLFKLYEMLSKKTFFAGKIPEFFYNDKLIKNVDLLQNEELAILNAIPTAEGTIKIALEEMDETIHESNVLIYGFGRIGKILCKRFLEFGANVYCVARKESDLAWIREMRCIPLKYDEVEKFVLKTKLIINTVPNKVINNNVLEKINKNCIIIDLASLPRRC